MIPLQTTSGVLYADVFIAQGDREIVVVLRRGSEQGQIVAFETFTPSTARRLKSDCMNWLRRRGLDDRGRLNLLTELESVFQMFSAIRTNGPDISHGWPGSNASRRLPSHDEFAPD